LRRKGEIAIFIDKEKGMPDGIPFSGL